MTPQERVAALQKAINLLADVEIKARYAEALVETIKLIKAVGEEIFSDASNAKIEE